MRTRTLTTALAALALALTAGCGSSADVAADGGGASGAAESSTGGGAGDGATVLTTSNFAEEITGAQLKAQTTRLTMTMSMGRQTMKAEADVKTASDPRKSAMAMSMDMSGESMKIIMVDGALYTKAEGMADGKWMKIGIDDVSGAVGGSFDQMRESMDPTASLQKLKGAMKDLKDTGETEMIDGVETKRYDAVLDTSKITELQGAAAARLPDEITYQYWVGPDDLPRKVVFDVAQIKSEITFSDWGKKVEVTAPPADQVTDASSMLGG